MANIDFKTAQIVVEKAMRDNGYGGKHNLNGNVVDFDEAWKKSLNVNGDNIDIPINYQNLRDIIAQSVVELLGANSVTGDITLKNAVKTNQSVTTSSNVLLNGTDVTAKGVARELDTITITPVSDPIFYTWLNAVSTAANNGTPNPAPLTITGKITSGSKSVKAGD